MKAIDVILSPQANYAALITWRTDPHRSFCGFDNWRKEPNMKLFDKPSGFDNCALSNSNPRTPANYAALTTEHPTFGDWPLYAVISKTLAPANYAALITRKW